MNRTYNTLFLLQSLDGKISTGDVDELDVDKDFKRVHGVKEGLSQYYDIEKTTDQFSLNSGKVMAKIGVNTRNEEPETIVIAPCLIGGKDTQSLVGGESLHNDLDLLKIKALKLKECKVLEQSYLHLIYTVINQTIVDENIL